MMIEITKKQILIFAVVFTISSIVAVYAYGGNNPQVLGHSGGEIDQGDSIILRRIFNTPVTLGSTLTTITNDVSSLRTDITSIQGRLLCPQDMQPFGDFCIETNFRNRATWIQAQATCTNLGRRLCTGEEWMTSCTTMGAAWRSHTDPSSHEWAGDRYEYGSYGGAGHLCADRYESATFLTDNNYFRCCRNSAH